MTDARKEFEYWYEKASPAERKELDGIKDDPEEIAERFSRPLNFGTAGMRGVVGLGTFRMNNHTVARATEGVAAFIDASGRDAKNRGAVISYDTRRFSLEFAKIAAGVFASHRIRTYLFENVRPVPMCSFAVRRLKAAVGVMITASHNPKEYNGYKVYGGDGAQMSPEDTAAVVKYIDGVADYFSADGGGTDFPASIEHLDNFKINDYVTIIGRDVDEAYYAEISKLRLSPEIVKNYSDKLKAVYTPIHGSGYIPVSTILERTGIDFYCVGEQTKFDAEFSTVPLPNPEDGRALSMGMDLGRKIGADIVIGTDPDCDRMGLAVRDLKGEFVLLKGNRIGALLLDYILTRLKETDSLPENAAVVKTIVTTTLADRICKDAGVKVFNVLTGFKFIGEKIKEWERTGEYSFVFGYEESYGYLRGTHARDKDAVVASMLTAEMACYYASKNKSLYQRLMELFEKYGYYTEDTVSISYNGVSAMEEMSTAMKNLRLKSPTDLAGEKILYTMDLLSGTSRYADGGVKKTDLPKSDVLKYVFENEQFVCVRPSGTEPKLKIYVLCYDKSPDLAEKKRQALLAAIRAEL